MRETTINYNGVILHNVLTDSIDQSVQLDPTGTDPIYVRTVASFTAILHMSGDTGYSGIGIHGGLYGAKADDQVGEAYQRLIFPLMQPRRRFQMYIGDVCVFDVWPGMERIPSPLNTLPLEGHKIDVNNGPIPSVQVVSVISANSIRIKFSVTAHIPYVDTPGAKNPYGISSFRFWIAENINCDDWTTTRVYHGRIRVFHLGYNVLEAFKQNLWCPALQIGFVRRAIVMTQSPNGLELEFTVEDKEVWAVPPAPATSWSGTHVMNASECLGTLQSTLDVTLHAPKYVAKGELMALAWKIVTKKLHYIAVVSEGQDYIKRAQWTDYLGDNKVSASATVQHVSPYNPIDDFCRPLNELKDGGFTGYDPGVAPLGYQTGSLPYWFMAWLNDPFHVNGWPAPGVNVKVEMKQERKGDKDPPPPPGKGLVIPSDGLSPSHTTAGMYNAYRMSSDYDVDRGTIMLPFSKSSLASGGSPGGAPSGGPGGGAAPATSGDSAVALSMHNGFATRTVVIDAERIGTWPTLPKPVAFTDGFGITHSVLSDHPHVSAPQLSADFTKTLYHVQYVLRYGLSRIPDYSKGEFSAGILPYRTAAGAVYLAIPGGAFDDPRTILG